MNSGKGLIILPLSLTFLRTVPSSGSDRVLLDSLDPLDPRLDYISIIFNGLFEGSEISILFLCGLEMIYFT